MIKIAKNRNK